MDDVINTSGHRLGAAEIEDAMVSPTGLRALRRHRLPLPGVWGGRHWLSHRLTSAFSVTPRLTTLQCPRPPSSATRTTSKEKVRVS